LHCCIVALLHCFIVSFFPVIPLIYNNLKDFGI
jgi:hypothetical protein